MLQVREIDFTAQMVWWWCCAFAHFRGNTGCKKMRFISSNASLHMV